jgi:uncharacterized SAM-binding protein YcdF (DUF218 family)
VRERRSSPLKLTLCFLVLLLLVFFTRTWWLTAIGWALVHDDGPAKADAAVVLGGDYWGYRISWGAEMVKQGYVPLVLVSGPPGFYGMNESDVAIRWAVQQGYPAGWFVAVPHQATSTRDEARVLLAYMRQHRIGSFLMVTSNYHSARARRVFLKAEREMGGGPGFRTVASPDKNYSPENWWQSREGCKTAFIEWTKTVTGALGI